MKKMLTVAMVLVSTTAGLADDFGTGANQFTIDFVTISGDASSANGANISQYSLGEAGYRTFTDPGQDYRIGVYEITNDQWNKFTAAYGTVTGDPSNAYDQTSCFTDTNVPTNNVSWYEAAQFVNWLNTSTGHHAAYRFTGTQGTGDYTLSVWDASEADGGTNLYRHKDAFYYLPTEDEWVKAAYWNGTSLQTYATKAGETLHQGDGTSGTGWNYIDDGHATDPCGPWNVGSGSQELNGTYDMMGNIWEWMENPRYSGDYGTGSYRLGRGGSYNGDGLNLVSPCRSGDWTPSTEYDQGFRIASDVPEPSCLAIFAIGGMALLRGRNGWLGERLFPKWKEIQ